jgi:2,3-bisphosphoglycerate-dependent phosphoglycerate mutase
MCKMINATIRNIYLVRHCKAVGQEPEAQLTNQGREDSYRLVDTLIDKEIDMIYSSPFKRAMETIKPFALKTGQEIIIDDRLKERVLSSVEFDDWMEKLEATYEDLELRFDGGETSNEATSRGIQFLNEVLEGPGDNVVVVSHGALISLLIRHYIKQFGFNEWKHMTNPDIFHMKVMNEGIEINRMLSSRR